MDSRQEKNSNFDESTEQVFGSRTARNADLYREIREADVGGYDVKSNAKVIDVHSGNNIDIDHIKSILDTHYNDPPRIHTIPIEESKPVEREKKSIFDTTKEYDLNAILNKAKEGREDVYEEDRAKRLHNTQFDILSNLNIDPKDYIEEYDNDNVEIEDTGERVTTSESESKTLQDLIDTIALNEKEIRKELNIDPPLEEDGDTDPLDIFSDLKGTDDTVTLEGLQEKTQSLLEELDANLEKTSKKEEPEDNNDIQEEKEKTTSLDNSFFTTSTKFNKKDFEEDFEDLKEDGKGSIVNKIIIIFLSIVFIAGLVILIKSFL